MSTTSLLPKGKNSSRLKRYVTWVALVAVFSIACWFLSQWQFARRAQVVASNNLVINNYDQKPAPFSSIVTNFDSFEPKLEWRPVSVHGKYLSNASWLVRNRPMDGNPGFLQLAAFRTDTGEILYIDRGWLPTGDLQDRPDHVPAVPLGAETLVGRLRAAEPKLDRTAPEGELPSIDTRQATSELPSQVSSRLVYTAGYLRLTSENPQADRGTELPKPELDEGNHLSYAFQWLLFALMAIGAVLWAIKQERLALDIDAGRKTKPPARRKVGDDDNEAEDLLMPL
jgi:cytochrome oxidase assembly protein ShyY1